MNYDIHWNPVRLVQRFGRIDRIGSRNDRIQLINFWPDMALDDYINLKARVETRMKALVMTSTGDDNLLSPEEQGDLEYRRRQLQRLQTEVVDLEEMGTGVSITDLGLNEFRMELMEYAKHHPELETSPGGISAVAKATPDAPAGVVFVLKNVHNEVNIDSRNRLHPYYLVYLSEDGVTIHDHLSPKDTLDAMRQLCRGKDKPIEGLYQAFNAETDDGRSMEVYSSLLEDAVLSIVDAKEDSDLDSLFKSGGTSALLSQVSGLDDFQLVCFLEYCLIYAKNIETLKTKHAESKWSVPKNNINEYIAKVKQLQKEGLTLDEITEELKTLTKYPRFVDFTNYWYFDERGLYSKGDLGGVPNGNKQPLWNPITQSYDPVPPGGFRFNPEKLEQLSKEGRIHFHTDGSLPRIKRYLDENLNQRPKSIMSDDQRPDSSMMQEFNTPFDNPKQLAFIKRVTGIADDDSIIFDFFSGSATTAHAVMQLNAEDGGHRKFIMVQLPEKCDEASEAYKVGYKTICEIGKERIRRAGDKIKAEHPDAQLDTGFRVFRVDESNMEDVYYHPEELTQTMLGGMVSNIKSDRSDLDLLYACLLDWDVEINLPHSAETLDGCTIHNVDDGALVACFDENVPDTVIRRMADLHPLRAVFRDSSFANDDSKINVTEIFKNLSPDTNVKVI